MSFYIYSHSRNYDCATKAISISIQSSEENTSTSYWYMTTMIQYIQGLIFSVRKFTEDSD